MTEISPGDALVRILNPAPIAVATEVALDLEGYGLLPARVQHAASGTLGLVFLLDEVDQIELAQWLVSANIERRQTRYDCSIEGVMRTAIAETPCKVTDISRTGARIDVQRAHNLALSEEIVLFLADHVPMTAVVRHIAGHMVGLKLISGYDGALPPPESETPA